MKSIDIDTIGAEPIAELDSSQGRLYLYGPGDVSLGEYRALDGLSDDERGSRLFRRLVRQQRRQSFAQDIPDLPDTVQQALTDHDVLQVADALRGAVDKEASLDDLTPNDRSPYAYVAALVDRHLSASAKRVHATLTKSMGAAAASLLGNLHESRNQLGSTVRALRELDLRAPIDPPVVIDHFQEDRRDLQNRIKLITQATTQSAEMLTNLVKTAEQFMLDQAQRDRNGRKALNNQMLFALGSLALSVFLSVCSVVIADKSYQHDIAKAKAEVARLSPQHSATSEW